MAGYIVRRLLLILPTLWAIITLNFFIVQIAPGGPVEQVIATMSGFSSGVMERISSANQQEVQQTEEANAPQEEQSTYRGARGLHPDVIQAIEKRFGFDKPIYVRYFEMLKSYLLFDFGESLFRGRSVIDLIIERLPVSISLGVWSTLIVYLVCIPLGIRKAVRHSSPFDVWTSTLVIFGSAIPGFLFAILLIIVFAGGTYLDWFPLRGLVSLNFDELTWYEKILDYFWHLFLPIVAMVIGGFATLTFLTKNSFLDELQKQYVRTARAKGLEETQILYGHIFRNAMLIIIAGFPAAFISMFFGSSVLIEVIFSLEGLGLLGFEAVLQRDYPVMFSTLYIFTLLGLVMGIISDLTYTMVDPRIDFEGR